MADGDCLILVLSAPSKVRAPFDAVSTFLVVRCRSGAQLWGSARRWLRSEFHYRSETIALVCLGPFVLLSVPPEANGFVAKLEAEAKAGHSEVDLQRLSDDGDQQPGRRAGQADAGRR